MKINPLLILFLFIFNLFSFSQEIIIDVKQVQGVSYISGNTSPIVAKEQALNEAKLNALRKANISEEIISNETFLTSESDDNFQDYYTSDFYSNLKGAIKLDDFYSTLSSTNASKITVFLDACFTGGGRNKSLVSSRGIKVVAKQGSLNGNLVVFSASSGDQSSLPFHKEKHGMFTYHLLKKLQNSKGKVTLDELASYLKKEVSIQSLIVNEQDQDPSVTSSPKVINDWRNWRF